MTKEYQAYALIYQNFDDRQQGEFSTLCVDFVRSNLDKRASECNKNSQDIAHEQMFRVVPCKINVEVKL